MTLYVGNKKIADTGVYGVYYEDQAIKSIYYGSYLVYEYITYTPGQKLINTGTPGTHTFDVIAPCTVNVILVGGGGGGAYSNSYGSWSNTQQGGSGGMITGQCHLSKGTYTMVVGNLGEGRYSTNGGGGATSSALAGGATTFLSNSAGGGGGAYTHTGYFDSQGRAGAAGTCSVVTSGLTGSNGAAGSTTNRYGDYGGGGKGSGGSNTGNNGKTGYGEINVVSVG